MHDMRRLLFTALVVVFTASGCVSLGKHEELKNNLAALEKESAVLRQDDLALKAEITQLRGKNEKLAAENSQLKQGAELLYRKGMEYYGLERYYEALDQFEKLADRYPADPLAIAANQKVAEIKALSSGNFQNALKALEGMKELRTRIEFLEKETSDKFFTGSDLTRLLHKRESYLAEAKLQDDVSKHILIEDDPTQSTRFYRTTHPVVQQVGRDKSFYIEVYIAQHYSGKKDLRLKTRYEGNRWISYDSVVIKGEGAQVEIICKYPDKLSNMVSERIYEWSDNDVDDEKMIKMSKGGPISVRFSGGYKYTFFLDDEQLHGIREIVRKYQSLK